MKQPVVLRIYKGDKLEAVRQFENSQIVIGRGGDVQLELQDDGVALLHAMIEDRDGEYYISDLGSQDGTFVNGERTLEGKLNSGDSLTLGAYRVQFFVGVPKPATPPKPVSVEPAAAPTSITYSSAVRQNPRVRDEVPAMPTEMPVEETPIEKPKQKVILPEPKATSATTTPPAGTSSRSATTAAAAAAGGMSIPQAKKTGTPFANPLKASHKTFAPASPYKDLKEILKPGKGSVVEVIVAWKDRVLSTDHFRQGNVSISSAQDADVVVPILSSASKYELLKIGPVVTVCLTQEMIGELIREGGEQLSLADLSRQGKLRNVGTHYELDLRQGEMIRIGLQDNLISIYVRYKADSPKPLVAPLMDMTSSEVTGIILALLVAGIGWFYMNIFTPTPMLDADEARIEQPIRKAIIKFNPPAHVEPPPEPEKKPEPPKEKKIVKAVEKPTKAPDPQPKRQTPTPSPEKSGDPGKGGNGNGAKDKAKDKPKENNKNMKQGGAKKSSPKEGAQMKAEKPDPTKQGLLGVFSSKGTQKQLDKAYAGSGELAGAANAATGYAGNAENRDGDNLGGKMKDTGSGGKGSGTIGIGGIGTQGRGTGTTGYGSGGIGTKGSVQINVGGQEGEFEGGMDKEAIRRVIREHLREIRACYETQLQQHPDLYGKVILQWDIGEAGKVVTASTKSNSLGNNSVAECILARLRTWKFPDPPAGMVGRVSYPFLFSSQ